MWKRILLTLEMIKFEHSVFALPFALTGALLAVRDGGLGGDALWRTLRSIVIAVVGARAAAWIAVRGSLDVRILWLTAAVAFWTAGFDIIYSCQDYEFDTEAGLFSLPRRLGIAGALVVSRLLHSAMLVCLLALVYTLQLGALSLAGIGVVASLLIYEHRLVKADDLTRVDAAFFTMNGYVSVLFFLFWAADI